MCRAVLALMFLLGVIVPGCAPTAAAGRVAGAVDEYWPSWHDAARVRDVAARLFMPRSATAATPAPLIIFSHGVGESTLSYAYLGQHWAGSGYVVLFVEHAGSDVNAVDWNAVTESLLRAARDPANWIARAQDLSFALDQLEADAALHVRIDFTRVAAAGHSLGAHTALAAAGMTLDTGDGAAGSYRDARITACIALSPPGANMLGLGQASWSGIAAPLLIAYGDLDTDIILKDASARRGAFDGAVGVERWLAILSGAEHETFTGRDPAFPLASDAPQHQTVIAAVTTAWLDACLRGDAGAHERLRAGGFDAACAGGCVTEYAPGP